MAFVITPTTVASGATITATGTGTRKRNTRIRVDGTLVIEFVMPSSGKFSKLITVPSRPDGTYTVALQQIRSDGVWAQTASAQLTIKNPVTPPPPPPPPPPPTITATQTIIDGSTISGSISWQVTFTGITPTKVDMLVDNVIKYTEYYAPWGDFGLFDTTTLTNGVHIFKINAYDSVGTLLITSSVSATVNNTVTPTLPPAPSNLAATAGDAKVTLGWG